VQEGYQILSHPHLRASYDRETTFRQETPAGRRVSVKIDSVEPARRAPLRDVSLSRSFESYEPSFDELFDRWWSNFNLLTRPKAERVEELAVDVLLSPAEIQSGGEVRIMVPAQLECPACGGEARVGGYRCWRCSGQGQISGEFPLTVEYPSLTPKGYFVSVPLDHLGIRNFYLTARFREAAEDQIRSK